MKRPLLRGRGGNRGAEALLAPQTIRCAPRPPRARPASARARQVRAETLKFKEEGVFSVLKDVFLPWYNAYRCVHGRLAACQGAGLLWGGEREPR